MTKVAIIGAGISGLSAAWWIQRHGLDVDIYERNGQPGGVIETVRENGYLFEKGPNSFLDNAPETLELCADLKLENELLKQSMRGNERYIFLDGRLQAVPTGPGGLIKTELLTGRAKRRLLKEPFRSANRSPEDESLADFVRRRLGREILDRLVTPFVSGVFAGDPEHLSLRASFPMLYELERSHGGLFRGMVAKMWKRKKKNSDSKKPAKPRAKNLCSFVDGMSVLPRAIAKSLGDRLHLNAPVTEIRKRNGSGYTIALGGNESRQVEVDAVVFAVPAYALAESLEPFLPRSVEYLRSIPYNRLNVVGMGYSRSAIEHPCDGFGFLVPRNQGVRILGSIWNSSLFVQRAPGGERCFSVFIGGALDPGAFDRSDEEILEQIKKDLQSAIGVADEPLILKIFRWERAIPQYPIGHVERIETLQNELVAYPGLYCVGNYFDGVSTNDCIRYAKKIAEEIKRDTHPSSPTAKGPADG